MKRTFKLFCYFVFSFLLLSIRVGDQSIFSYLDNSITPYSVKALHTTKNQILNGFTFVKAKASDLFSDGQTVDHVQKRLSSPKRNRYGHRTYGAKEREEMLNRLSNSLQKR